MVRLPESVFAHVLQSSLSTLEPSWDWVVSLMDVAEGQLQRGTQFDTQVSVVEMRFSGICPMICCKYTHFFGYENVLISTFCQLVRSARDKHSEGALMHIWTVNPRLLCKAVYNNNDYLNRESN